MNNTKIEDLIATKTLVTNSPEIVCKLITTTGFTVFGYGYTQDVSVNNAVNQLKLLESYHQHELKHKDL